MLWVLHLVRLPLGLRRHAPRRDHGGGERAGTSKAIRQEIDSEELGGWRMHTQSTGLVDALAETDEEALEIVKKWLAYFPSNQNEPPPRQAVTPESVPDTGAILQHVPTDSNKVYDVRKAIDCIVDRDSVMELKARFGRSICTMVARLDGHPVGILASNPMFKGGAIDVDACNKGDLVPGAVRLVQHPAGVPGRPARLP